MPVFIKNISYMPNTIVTLSKEENKTSEDLVSAQYAGKENLKPRREKHFMKNKNAQTTNNVTVASCTQQITRYAWGILNPRLRIFSSRIFVTLL